MTRRPKGGQLANRNLMHTAARLHYLEGASQLEVSRRMEVSTATVSRLLAQARKEGIVRIQVVDLDEADDIGDRLSAALKLRAVRVVEGDKAAALAGHTGNLLSGAALGQGSVVAIGWGRTVQSVITAGLPALSGVIAVPATGGMHETAAHFQITEFVRMAAEQMQGSARFLYAPSLASAELRHVLMSDPETAHVLDLWSRVDAAILGIGDFKRATSGHDIGFDTEVAERVTGDVARHYFDADGREIRWPGQDNLMAISREQLCRIPLSIGVAIGRDKARAAIGAVRSGMINALVTDTRLARAILDELHMAERP